MENASKALLIAGAILLTIAIIAIAMTVLNNGRKAIEGANMDSLAIQTFNNQFTPYLGESMSASEVRDLIVLMKSGNVEFGTVNNSTTEVTSMTGVKNGSSYYVDAIYNEATGKITSIRIATSVMDQNASTSASS